MTECSWLLPCIHTPVHICGFQPVWNELMKEQLSLFVEAIMSATAADPPIQGKTHSLENGPPSKKSKGETPRDIPWWKDVRNIQAAQCYARLKGILYSSDNNVAVNPPLSLYPCNFPQELYKKIWTLQPAMNSLVDAVSRDLEFLEEALARCVAN